MVGGISCGQSSQRSQSIGRKARARPATCKTPYQKYFFLVDRPRDGILLGMDCNVGLAGVLDRDMVGMATAVVELMVGCGLLACNTGCSETRHWINTSTAHRTRKQVIADVERTLKG